jgi:hypothetical protein
MPQVFTGAPPWGVLSGNNIYKLVVRENDRPDRPEPHTEQKCGLTDEIWGIIAASWQKDAALRPAFNQIVEWWNLRNTEDTLETLRPPSPSTSVTGQISVLI